MTNRRISILSFGDNFRGDDDCVSLSNAAHVKCTPTCDIRAILVSTTLCTVGNSALGDYELFQEFAIRAEPDITNSAQI